jgi:hypothetical protein
MLALGRVGVAEAADAQQTAMAEQLFRDARSLMQEARYEEALAKLQASQELDPGIGTLLNLADCFERLGRTASAWATFTEAAQRAHRDGDLVRGQAADERAKALETKLVRVQISAKSGSDGKVAVVELDGKPLSPALYGIATPVDPGPHRLVARLAGMQSFETSVDVVGEGQTVTVSVPALLPVNSPAEKTPDVVPVNRVAVPTPSKTNPSESSPRAHTLSTAEWLLGGTGLLALAVGSGYATSAWLAWDDAKDQGCKDGQCPTPSAQKRAEAAGTRADIATGGLLLGGALVATAGVLYFFVDGPSEPERLDSGAIRFNVELTDHRAAAAASFDF